MASENIYNRCVPSDKNILLNFENKALVPNDHVDESVIAMINNILALGSYEK